MKVLVVLLLFQMAHGARILCVYPIPSTSHQIVHRVLTQELARRGHELVVIATEPHMPNPSPNVTEFDLKDLSIDIWRKGMEKLAAKTTEWPPYTFHNKILKTARHVFDAQLDELEVKALINNKGEHFDLIIVSCVARFTYFFTHRFKAPVIGFSTLMGLQYNYDSVGAPTHPLLYPDMMQTKLDDLSIFDKIDAIYTDIWQRYSFWKMAEEDNIIGRKHFGEDTPDIRELVTHTDLLFLNVNPVWDGIRPAPPSVIYVGGIHIKPPKELPKELQKYLDGCKQGVIYMSLGSNIKSVDLPPEKLDIFLQVFSNLPFCVLWKWESNHLPGKPENVKLEKWLPQTDLLVHPNIRAFITQGGLQSTDEAIVAQVPLIGIPFMIDQGRNVQKMISHGVGIGLDIKTITTEALAEAIHTVTTDESFHKNLQRLSAIFKDEPMKPLDRAIWWIEYLLRHGHAHHLRSPASGISFYEYLALDVLALVVGVILTVSLLVNYMLRVMYVQAMRFLKQNQKRKVA